MSKQANQTPLCSQPRRHAATTLPLPPDAQASAWKPQPSHLSRDELRRIVLEIMG